MSYTGKNPKFDSVILKDEGSGGSPANPASGQYKLINRSGSLYMLDSSGNEVPVGSSAGGLNLITDPNAETGVSAFTDVGTGTTVSQTTTASQIPLDPFKSTAIRIANDGSGTGYTRTRFTLPAAWKGQLNGFSWIQRPDSGYSHGDYKIELYYNSASDYTGGYTEVSLVGDDSSGDSDIHAETGVYQNQWLDENQDYYELRFYRVAGSNALNINELSVSGSRVLGSGAVVGSWESVTMTSDEWSSATITAYRRRVGEEAQFRVKITGVGAATNPQLRINLPSGNTFDTTTLQSGATGIKHLGIGSMRDAGTATYPVLVAYYDSNTVEVQYISETGSSTQYTTATNTAPFTWNDSSDTAWLEFTAPISEWTGSGTMNVLQEDNLSEWTSFTPSWAGLTSTSENEGWYKRVGSDMEIYATAVASGAVGANITLTVPDSKTINTDIVNTASSLNYLEGTAYARDVGAESNNKIGLPVAESTTTISIRGQDGSSTRWAASTPFTWASNDRIAIRCKVPISEWANVNQNSLVGFSEATGDNAGLIKYDLQTVTLDSGFTGGTADCVKIGKLVTITLKSATWSSGTVIDSSSGLVPSNMRPANQVQNIQGEQTSVIQSFRVLANGTLRIVNLSPTSLTSTSAAAGTGAIDYSISYVLN